MKFALSTCYFHGQELSGEEIVDRTLALGFSALELGYQTTEDQVGGFKARLDELPVGSVHAFCPVPLSAPCGYPELYQLASFDEEGRKMARFQITKNIRFASEMGAKTLVLHAGRVPCASWFKRLYARRRLTRGRKMIDVFRRELDFLAPELEKRDVVLGLENMPYVEGFPNASEINAVTGERVRPWLDTGHAYVLPYACENPIGLHINDSQGGDDHLAPGKGKVDFASLRAHARSARHLVFEPNAAVTADNLKEGLALLRTLWTETNTMDLKREMI